MNHFWKKVQLMWVAELTTRILGVAFLGFRNIYTDQNKKLQEKVVVVGCELRGGSFGLQLEIVVDSTQKNMCQPKPEAWT